MKSTFEIKSLKKGKNVTLFHKNKEITIDECIKTIREDKFKTVKIETFESEQLLLSGWLVVKNIKNLKSKINDLVRAKV